MESKLTPSWGFEEVLMPGGAWRVQYYGESGPGKRETFVGLAQHQKSYFQLKTNFHHIHPQHVFSLSLITAVCFAPTPCWTHASWENLRPTFLLQATYAMIMRQDTTCTHTLTLRIPIQFLHSAWGKLRRNLANVNIAAANSKFLFI